MSRTRWFLGATALSLALSGCAGGFTSATTPVPPANSKNVVIVSAAGKIATSTPAGAGTRIPPTPTFDPGFGSVLTPLAASPTPQDPAGSPSPTPQLRPTRTIAPTVTPLPTLEVPPTATRRPIETPTMGPTRPPTNTPVRPNQPTRPPTWTPSATPVDPNEAGGSNNDLASATSLDVDTEMTGVLSGPGDVDVYRVDILDEDPDQQIVVNLTGQDMNLYQLFLITPGRRSSAFGTPVGTVSRHIVYPTRGETGTYYVEVSAAPGNRVPKGNYTVSVGTRSLVEPLPLE